MRIRQLLCSVAAPLAALLFCVPARAATDPPQPEVAAAFDFETPTDLTAWHDEDRTGEAPSIIALDPVNPQSGKFSLKVGVDRDAATSHDAYCRITTKDRSQNRKLMVDFYARTTLLHTGEASFRVLEWANGKPTHWIGNKENLVAIAGNGWTKYHEEAPLSDGTDDLNLYVFLLKPTAGEAVWIDDLKVKIAH
ncbi:MAG: hypothetical protein P4L33_15540 [Capsulimonadaceae bacterium]|nr:hypothetical protein [Capsulimonadaceae bacterium]